MSLTEGWAAAPPAPGLSLPNPGEIGGGSLDAAEKQAPQLSPGEQLILASLDKILTELGSMRVLVDANAQAAQQVREGLTEAIEKLPKMLGPLGGLLGGLGAKPPASLTE